MSTLPNTSCRSTPSSTYRPGFRLKQTPIDKWSFREKLALASSVHRSGDQNWYSVSRSLKCFGEPNRPADWFSQKNCALQYSELLENVETPKRKRGERGENTAQDLIVLELQQKRINELKEIILKEKKDCNALRDELEHFKSGEAGEEKFREVWERMKKDEKDKEIAAEEHKKWLVEREAKIAQMKANRHLELVRSPKSVKSNPVAVPNENEVKSKPEIVNVTDNPPLPEPLTVKIEPPSTDTDNSQSTTPQTPTSTAQPTLSQQQIPQMTQQPQQLQQTQPSQQTHQAPQTPERTKVMPSPVISSPSTSPLLTHLLQSPSPSANVSVPYNILSPSTLKDLQQKTSPSTTHFFPSNTITSPTLPRKLETPISSSSQSMESIQSSATEESKIPIKEITEPSSTTQGSISSPPVISSSPTLSKLLETSSTSSIKPITLPTKEVDQPENISQDVDMKEMKENVPEVTLSTTTAEQIETKTMRQAEPSEERVIETLSIEKTVNDELQLNKKDNESVTEVDISEEISTFVNADSDATIVSKDVPESTTENVNVDKVITIADDQITTEIKQELIEAKESLEELPVIVESKIIKIEEAPELEEIQPTTPAKPAPSVSNGSAVASSSSRKRKRTSVQIAETPPTAPTRRSNRVRTNKDKTSSEEEQALLEENSSVGTSTSNPSTTVTASAATSAVSAVLIPTPSGGKKTPVTSSSVLPPPPPPPSTASTEISAGEESNDNTAVSLIPTLIKAPASAPTTAPTSKASSITESAPNSPASAILTSEEIENQKECKMWKKSIMLLWRQAATHKFSTLFAHPVTDSEAKGYSTVVYRPMDLFTIRKKIENGQIKTTAEFQRDMMLMFQNAIMYNSVDHDVHQMAVEMQKEILEGIEDFIETQQKSTSVANEPTKPRGRRSNVSTSSDAHETPESAELRRRKRVSTDAEPISTPSTSKSKTKKKPN